MLTKKHIKKIDHYVFNYGDLSHIESYDEEDNTLDFGMSENTKNITNFELKNKCFLDFYLNLDFNLENDEFILVYEFDFTLDGEKIQKVAYIKGAVRIGILQPKQRVINSFSQNDVWQQVVNVFFSSRAKY